MKKYIYILILLSSIKLNTLAQSSAMQTRFDTCNYLKQFTGEWVYANGLDTIKIYLRFHREQIAEFESATVIKDFLLGWHEYKQGNTIVESNYSHRLMYLPFNLDSLSNDYSSIYLTFNRQESGCGHGSRKLNGIIKDYHPPKSESHDVDVVINSAGTTMTWKQQFAEWYKIPVMTLPPNFVLIKQ
jgi:hypothetical protein